MISLLEAKGYRCLRYVRQPLDAFHMLVGPNASGKTTFLDAISFLGRLVSDGPEAAIEERTQNFDDLLWGRNGTSFELALEARIPDSRKATLSAEHSAIRYEVSIGKTVGKGEVGITEERVFLTPQERGPDGVGSQLDLFPRDIIPPDTILSAHSRPSSPRWQRVLSKAPNGNDNYYSEAQAKNGKGWFPSIKLGHRKSTLGNLPEDEQRFPASIWLKSLLTSGVQSFMLNSLVLRHASPPGRSRTLRPDGGNLPWIIEDLRKNRPDSFQDWLAHMRTVLGDLQDIQTVERQDDKHRYIKLCYAGGLEVPSWMVSDGTLRLLALTLPAYLPDFQGVYLIEEPENGIHPRAIEAVYQSLSSVYSAQILLASHSPVMLGVVDARKVLCFKKSDAGATDIVLGSDHPGLRGWRGTPNLSVLFAGGVLG